MSLLKSTTNKNKYILDFVFGSQRRKITILFNHYYFITFFVMLSLPTMTEAIFAHCGQTSTAQSFPYTARKMKFSIKDFFSKCD